MARDDKAFLKLARDRFEQAQTADRSQREREREDLRFLVDQWPADIRKARAAQEASGGLPAVPARPCIQIDKISAPIQQVLNEERQADLGIELVAADDFGDLGVTIDETEIDLREGLIRLIQRHPDASQARLWAADRAAKCGRGYYGVMTRFRPGKTRDQEIYVERYYNQFCVTLDPFHEQPDGSDAGWGFVWMDLSEDKYKTAFPWTSTRDRKPRRNQLSRRVSKDEFRALGDEAPGWFTEAVTEEGKKKIRSYRVANYWYTELTPRTLLTLTDGSVEWEDEVSNIDREKALESREVVESTVKWAKIDGSQILEETDWPGPDIPIIKVMGEELQPYDKERRAEGMVRGARDPQIGFNAMVSTWVHKTAVAPEAPFQPSQEHIEGYEAWYAAAATRSLPYLPYNLFASDGSRLDPPPRTPTGTDIAAYAASASMFDEAIKSTTGKGDPELGHVDPSLKSGKVVESLKRQSQFGTSHFLDNLKRSVAREGEIINRLLYPIYGQRPGRLVRIMTSEGESQVIPVAPPAAPAPAQGASTPGQPQAAGPPPMGAPGANLGGSPGLPGASPVGPTPPKEYRLTKEADASVTVKVIQSAAHRRDQENAFLAELPPEILMGWFGDLFFKNQDGPGHLEMAERAKVMLDPKIQAAIAQKANGGALPPQAMQEIAQLKKQLQDAEGVIQKAQQDMQAKQTEWAARGKIAADDREFKGTMELEIAHIRAEQAIAVAEITKRLDVFMAERDRIGVPAAQVSAQAHEAATATADAQHDLNLSQQEHQQTLEQGQQAAALAPPPSDQGAPPTTSPQADGSGD